MNSGDIDRAIDALTARGYTVKTLFVIVDDEGNERGQAETEYKAWVSTVFGILDRKRWEKETKE